MPLDSQNVETGRAALARPLDVLEERLALEPYLAGPEFSLADLGYLPYIDYLFVSKEGDLITSRPHVAAWWQRISTRPSWKKALSQK